MTRDNLFCGLKPLTTACLSVFAPFYEERAKHYVYPRYAMSVCGLLDLGKCYYNIIRAKNGRLLVIFKRTQIFGKIGVQMPVTPISEVGSVQDELDAIKCALSCGISLRVTSEDITRYHIPRKYCSDGTGPFVPVNNEYIYDARLGSDMTGARYRKHRYQTKAVLDRQGCEVTQGIHPQADDMVKVWNEHYQRANGEKANQSHLWEIIKQASRESSSVTIRNIIVDGVLQGVSVLERIAPKHHIIIFRIRNYGSKALNDVGSAMQFLDCSACVTDRGRAFLNMGLADTEGLIKSKEALIPCAHQKIYTVKTKRTDSNLKAIFL